LVIEFAILLSSFGGGYTPSEPPSSRYATQVSAASLGPTTTFFVADQRPQPRSAEKLWTEFVELGLAFDPALADLYADDAVIRMTRRYPGGRLKTLSWSGADYKPLIRRAMPIARNRGDIDIYSQVTFQAVGDGVRIQATRYSTLKKYRAPHELTVAAGPDGVWRIVEERGESRP
jgi:hypothetical protein